MQYINFTLKHRFSSIFFYLDFFLYLNFTGFSQRCIVRHDALFPPPLFVDIPKTKCTLTEFKSSNYLHLQEAVCCTFRFYRYPPPPPFLTSFLLSPPLPPIHNQRTSTLPLPFNWLLSLIILYGSTRECVFLDTRYGRDEEFIHAVSFSALSVVSLVVDVFRPFFAAFFCRFPLTSSWYSGPSYVHPVMWAKVQCHERGCFSSQLSFYSSNIL